jgi:hypothetical protein
MHLSLGPWRRWLSTFALTTIAALGFLLAPARASAQAKDRLDLVPGGAFGVIDFRLSSFIKSDFFALLPPHVQTDLVEHGFNNPLRGKALTGMTLVFLEPRDFLPGRSETIRDDFKEPFPEKDFDIKDKDFDLKGKDFGKEPIKRKVPGLEDLDERALSHAGSLQIFSYAEPVNLNDLERMGWAKTTYKGKSVYYRSYATWLVPLNDQVLVTAHSRAPLKRLLDAATPAKGGLSPLLARVKKDDAHAVLAIDGTGPAVAAFRKEFTDRLDDSFGFFPFNSMLEPFINVESLYARLNMQGRPKLEGDARFLTREDADKGAESIRDAIVLFRVLGCGGMRQAARYSGKWDHGYGPDREAEPLVLHVFADELETALRGAKVEQEKNSVRLAVEAPRDVAAVKATMVKIAKEWASDPRKAEARLRRQSINNLRQIGIALHSFHDATKNLPPQAICDPKSGKPLLSWRVAILPYIEQGPLYRQFKLDEPWDSAHNIKLLDQMPPQYAPVVPTKEKNVTFYQGFSGPGTMFEMTRAPESPWGARGTGLARIPDGTANTIMVVEAGTAVPWSKPEDLTYEPSPKWTAPKLGGMFKDGFHVLYGDASAGFVRFPVSSEELRRGVDGRDGRDFSRRWEK